MLVFLFKIAIIFVLAIAALMVSGIIRIRVHVSKGPGDDTDDYPVG